MRANDSLLIARLDFDYERFLSLVNPEAINETDYDGYAPLHSFVFFYEQAPDRRYDEIERIKVIKQLLAWKANINQADRSERTPLYRAVENRDDAIISCLLDNKANINVKPNNRLGLKELACVSEYQGDFPMVKLLMLRGVKLRAFRNAGECIEPTNDMKRFYESIQQAREATTIFVRLRTKSPLLKLIGKDITLLIARQIYATRGNPVWSQ